MTTLICVGTSHLAAVAKGAPIAEVEVVAFPIRVRKESGRMEQRGRSEVWAEVSAAVADRQARRIFAFIGGGTPAVIGLVQHPQPFDFAFPDQPGPLRGDAEVLPYDVIHGIMLAHLRRHFRKLGSLTGLGVPVVQCESPPPVPDDAFLIRSASKFAPDIEELGVSPPALRHKLWSLHSRIYAAFCEAHDITYVRNPPEVFDDEGFLKREYWGDFVHGNARYGAALLAHLKEMA